MNISILGYKAYKITGKMDARVVRQQNRHCPGGDPLGSPRWNNVRFGPGANP